MLAGLLQGQELVAQIFPGLALAGAHLVLAQGGHAILGGAVALQQLLGGKGRCWRGRRRVVNLALDGLRHLAGLGRGLAVGGGSQSLFHIQSLRQHVAVGVLPFHAGDELQRALVVLEPGRAQTGGAVEGVVGKAAVGMTLRHLLIAGNGVEHVFPRKGTARQFFQRFGGTEKRGRSVGPLGIVLIDGLKFLGDVLPGLAQTGALFVHFKTFCAFLGRGVAFFRGRKGAVTGVVAAHHQQTEPHDEQERRRQTLAQSRALLSGLGGFVVLAHGVRLQ